MSKYNRVIDSKFSQVIDPYDAQFGIRDVGKKLWKRGADDITKLIKKNRPRLSKSRVDTKSYTRALPSGSPGDIVDVPVKALPGDNGSVTPTTRMPRSNNDQAWPLGRQGAPAPAPRGQRALPPGKPGDVAPIKPDYSNIPMQRPDSMKSANVGDDFARANLKPRPLQSATPGDVVELDTQPYGSSKPTSQDYVGEINQGIRDAKDRQAYKNRRRKAYDAGRQSEARGETWTSNASPAAARQQGWINPKSVGGAAAAAATVGAGAYGVNRMMKKKKEEEEDGYEQG
jgi:hypothetical protein